MSKSYAHSEYHLRYFMITFLSNIHTPFTTIWHIIYFATEPTFK